MEHLWDLIGTSWWFYLQSLLTIAMLIHSFRSGAEHYWFWIILVIQPFGAWAYFFLVFLRSLRPTDGGGWPAGWERKASLAELEHRAERTPTVNNRLALAQKMMDLGRHRDAIPLLEAVLATDQIHCGAMYALALCRLESGQPLEAVHLLRRLLERDYRWSNYRGWRTLIDAQLAAGNAMDALESCRQLQKRAPTWEHKCLLAELLIDNDLAQEAAVMLEQALEDHAFAPFGTRLKNWRWARKAQQLLRDAQG